MATIPSRNDSSDDRPPREDVVGHIGPGGAAGPEPTVTIRRSALRRAWSGALSGPEDDRDDDYDALTDLFLGEVGISRSGGPGAVEAEPAAEGGAGRRGVSEAAAAPVAQAVAAPRVEGEGRAAEEAGGIEALILGHLPVLSAAWAAQYARTIAEAEGTPVAFVQVRGGHVSVEQIGGEGGATERAADLAGALERAAAVTGRWIVRADETDEPSLARLAGVRWLTLLTSADEAAVVSAYRAIKHLAPQEALASAEEASEDQGRARTWGEWPGPAVRVAVMGAADEAADAAYGKIAAAVRTFLGRPIRRAPGAGKIHAARPARSLFTGRSDLGAAGVVEAIEALLLRRRTGGGAGAARVLAPAAAPVSSAVPATAGAGGVTAAEPRASAAGRPLARHIAGLGAVDVACPYAPGVEFAVGPEGRLHVLARRESGGGAAGAVGVEPLLVASAWAEAHGALLRRVVVGAGGGGGGASEVGGGAGTGRPVAHLFVEEPREVRGLLDTEVRVHLLATVAVGGETAWVCKDLN
jgi:hypothetical protein